MNYSLLFLFFTSFFFMPTVRTMFDMNETADRFACWFLKKYRHSPEKIKMCEAFLDGLNTYPHAGYPLNAKISNAVRRYLDKNDINALYNIIDTAIGNHFITFLELNQLKEELYKEKNPASLEIYEKIFKRNLMELPVDAIRRQRESVIKESAALLKKALYRESQKHHDWQFVNHVSQKIEGDMVVISLERKTIV